MPPILLAEASAQLASRSCSRRWWSRRTLRRWRQRGAPGFADDAPGVEDLKAVRAWRESIRPRSAIDSDRDLARWTAEFRKAKALLAVLDVKERKGHLIAIDEHKRKMVSLAADFRQLLQMPKRMCHLLHGLAPDEIRERLASECERILAALQMAKLGASAFKIRARR